MSTANCSDRQFDLVLVGGGLQNGLIALAVLARRPDAAVAIVERQAQLGGNHTWCLHPRDVPAGGEFVEPLIVHRWAGYDVRFPTLVRTLRGGYAAVTSERFAAVVGDAIARSPGSRCFLGRRALEVQRDVVTLEDDSQLRGRLVVDARGPALDAHAGRSGYQKFLGLELELEKPHGLLRPILMDACVEQRGGFRFFYLLPLDPSRLLVEDTTFSLHPSLDLGHTRTQVLNYATRFGAVRRVLRQEVGVLPMPWEGAASALRQPLQDGPLVAGYRGGFFHPATGYSFPCALRVASHLAARHSDYARDADFDQLRRSQEAQTRYAERLNWLLFHGFEPQDMWNVFERFYRLPEPLIHRFYAMTTTPLDRARIVAGKPPRGLSLKALVRAGRAPEHALGELS